MRTWNSLREMLAIGLCCMGLGMMVLYGAVRVLYEPGPLTLKQTVVIPYRTTTGGIAQLMVDHRVVPSSFIFYAMSMLYQTQQHTLLKAGEYVFLPHISMHGVLQMLLEGETVIHRFTIPEGTTTASILALLRAQEAFIGDPPTEVAEGTLLPDTYFFSLGETREAFVERMRRQMKVVSQSLWEARDPNLPIDTLEEAIILASIVEKETCLNRERQEIAAVFLNRLRRGMKLQADPTVIYALTAGKELLNRPLTRKDLQIASPYNTYMVHGIPPGPIANPGRASLYAVLHPSSSQALYFVADGEGGHAFANSLSAHRSNVQQYRKKMAAIPAVLPQSDDCP